jgi:iron uptake system component EfeO
VTPLSTGRFVRTGFVSLVLCSAMGTLAACGSGSDTSASGSPTRSTGAEGGAARARTGTVAVTLSDSGCKAEPSTVSAGPLTFKVTNVNAAAVSELELLQHERILGEKENLAPGFGASFSLDLGGGTYKLYCPGAADEYTDFTVTGKSSSSAGSTAALFKEGAAGYGSYVEQQSGLLVDAVRPLVSAIRAGHLGAARLAYAAARPYYERIEPVAESFTTGKVNLDARIDARAGDVPVSQWSGFHVIEKSLFRGNSVKGLLPVATGLQTDVEKLRSLVTGLSYQPSELLNGAGGLLDEVAKSKITGEEERYSHIDLLDFQANVEGAEQAFANIRPGLSRVDSSLADEIAGRFQSIDRLLEAYRDPHALGGFVRYRELTSADKKRMSADVQALKEPLSSAAAKVAAAS